MADIYTCLHHQITLDEEFHSLRTDIHTKAHTISHLNQKVHVTQTKKHSLRQTLSSLWEDKTWDRKPISAEHTAFPFSSKIFQKWGILFFSLPHLLHQSRQSRWILHKYAEKESCRCSIWCSTMYSKCFHARENNVPVRRQYFDGDLRYQVPQIC